jgi:hypothetical protein
MAKSLKIPKEVIRSHKSKKDKQNNDQKEKGQTMNYKVPHKKLKIEQQEPYLNPGVNSGAPEGLIIPALLEAHIVLILLQVH